MPHSIFLGSALATQDRRADRPEGLKRDDSSVTNTSDSRSVKVTGNMFARVMRKIREGIHDIFRVDPIEYTKHEARSHEEHVNNNYAFVRAHIYHGMIDIAISLLGIAVVINSL